MAAGSAGEGAGSNTELRWTFSRLACQSEMALAQRTEHKFWIQYIVARARERVRETQLTSGGHRRGWPG